MFSSNGFKMMQLWSKRQAARSRATGKDEAQMLQQLAEVKTDEVRRTRGR